MATFKQYDKKDGHKAWSFQAYLGVDPTTGKEVRTTRRGFRTKKMAQLELDRLKVSFAKVGLTHPQQITFQALYEQWLIEYQNTVKESTLVKTKGYFKHHIIPAFGNMLIDKITIPYTQRVVNQWADEMKKFKTILNYTGMVFEYAIKLDFIQKNPTKYVTRPKAKETAHSDKWENFYDKTELQTFFKCLAQEDAHHGNHEANTLFRLLAFTGMRKGEALALMWDDIDFTQRTLTIDKALTRGENARLYVHQPKTAYSNRVLDLDPKTVQVLKGWQIIQRQQLLMLGFNINATPNQLVFSNSKNTFLQPSKIRKWLTHIITKYDLKYITVHGFRHTHASLLFEAGASIKQVQAQLGL